MSRALSNRHLAAKLIRIDISGRLAADRPQRELSRWTDDLESAPFYETNLLAASTPEVVRVGAIATALTRAWDEIEKELDSNTEPGFDARAAKLDLANHTWCDLIIALVQFIEQARKLMKDLRKQAREFVAKALHGSSRSPLRDHLKRAVVDLVFNKVWSALETLFLAATGPIAVVIASKQILRALRILAVFICPAPSEHREVQLYALQPLEKDARGYFSDQTKQRALGFFSDWPANRGGQDGPLPGTT